MTPEEREAFYKDVPIFMKHCPHMFIMQQQMKAHKEMMEKQQVQREEMMLRQSMNGGIGSATTGTYHRYNKNFSLILSISGDPLDHNHFNDRAAQMMTGNIYGSIVSYRDKKLS